LSSRLLSFSPSVERVESRDQLVDYTWKLKGINAEDYDFSEANGKVVVLNFWATWCPPCRAEMPSLQNLYADYKDKVVFLFLTNEEDAVVNKFLDKYDYTIPSFNQYSKTPNNFSVSSIPATYVLDKDGFIVIDKVGPALWDSDKVRKLLDELLMK
jgi:thiol-disulfide isomerase/thioredoxin